MGWESIVLLHKKKSKNKITESTICGPDIVFSISKNYHVVLLFFSGTSIFLVKNSITVVIASSCHTRKYSHTHSLGVYRNLGEFVQSSSLDGQYNLEVNRKGKRPSWILLKNWKYKSYLKLCHQSFWDMPLSFVWKLQ